MKFTILNSSNFLCLLVLSLTTLSSCNKEYVTNGYLPPIDIPDSASVVLGDTLEFQLAAEFSKNQANYQITVNHPGQQVDAQHTLLSLVQQAIEVDVENGKVYVYSGRLYPSGSYSEDYQNTIPNNYAVVLKMSDNSGTGLKSVTKMMNIYVRKAKISLESEVDSLAVLTPYTLYKNLTKSYTMSIKGLSTESGTFKLANNYGNKDSFVDVSGEKLILSKGAGDANQKKEHVYLLRPEFYKNGYKIADQDIKLSLLPNPKFIYGIYYPEYDLTIIYNRFVIASNSGFTSDQAVIDPIQYRGIFSIESILKDNVSFIDSKKAFSINPDTGSISLKRNSELTPGEYKMIIQNKSSDGTLLSTEFTLVLQQVE